MTFQKSQQSVARLWQSFAMHGLKNAAMRYIIIGMINSISDFHRFAYLEENFEDLRDYCNDNGIWICQSLRRKGPMTFALARSEDMASALNRKFG